MHKKKTASLLVLSRYNVLCADVKPYYFLDQEPEPLLQAPAAIV